jgi:hypothetical protein
MVFISLTPVSSFGGLSPLEGADGQASGGTVIALLDS